VYVRFDLEQPEIGEEDYSSGIWRWDVPPSFSRCLCHWHYAIVGCEALFGKRQSWRQATTDEKAPRNTPTVSSVHLFSKNGKNAAEPE
jgi:hypothetical protein